MAALFWQCWREYRLVNSSTITAWEIDDSADCAVVLTGGANRVREGFDLLSRGLVKKLIISGVNQQSELRDIFPQWPFYGNLDAKDVILEKRSQTTFGNAQQSLALVQALRCRDIVLITSRLHMYRAVRTFRAEFPKQIQIIPHSIYGSRSDFGWVEHSLETAKSFFYSLWAY